MKKSRIIFFILLVGVAAAFLVFKGASADILSQKPTLGIQFTDGGCPLPHGRSEVVPVIYPDIDGDISIDQYWNRTPDPVWDWARDPVGRPQYTMPPGEGLSYWATDEAAINPDCASIFLSSSIQNWGRDFRFGIQISDKSRSWAIGCGDQVGEVRYTPWASDGGGWSEWAADSYDRKNFNCARLAIQTRPLTNRKIDDVRAGIQFSDFQCSGQFGAEQYTPWASDGGGWSEWAADADRYDPDCIRINLESITSEISVPPPPPPPSPPPPQLPPPTADLKVRAESETTWHDDNITIPYNSRAVFQWTSQNTEGGGCWGFTEGTNFGVSLPTSGEQLTVNLKSAYTFGVICQNALGTRTAPDLITVNVSQESSPASLVVEPASQRIRVGETFQFKAYYDPDGNGPAVRQEVTDLSSWSSANPGVAIVLGGLSRGLSQGNANIIAGYSGLSASGNLEVVSAPAGPPTVDLKVNGQDGPITVAQGQSAIVTWAASNVGLVAQPCQASSQPSTLFQGSQGPNGIVNTGILYQSQYTLSITCQNSAGQTAEDSVIINVGMYSAPDVRLSARGPAETQFREGSITIPYNTEATLRWSTSNAVSCEVSPNWPGGAPGPNDVGERGTGNLRQDQTYILLCRGAGNTQNQRSVAVNVGPLVDLKIAPEGSANFVEGPINLPQPARATLQWSTANAASCSTSTNWPSGAQPTTNDTNRQRSTGMLGVTQTYTLSCISPSGASLTDSVTVNVIPPGPGCNPNEPNCPPPPPPPPPPPVEPSFVIAPPSATVGIGGEFQFRGLYDRDGPSSQYGEENVTATAQWSSSNTSVATVSSGLARGVSEGTIQIRATYNNIPATASLSVERSPTRTVCNPTLSICQEIPGSGSNECAAVNQSCAPPNATLVIRPSRISIEAPGTGILNAYYDVDGSGPQQERNVSDQVQWSSSDETKARHSPVAAFPGRFEGVAATASNRPVIATARYLGLQATADIEVTQGIIDNYHLECGGNNICTRVFGPGVNTCSSEGTACGGPPRRHLECEANRCVRVPGSGPSLCEPEDGVCGPGSSHFECRNNTCTEVSGPGSNNCSSIGAVCISPPPPPGGPPYNLRTEAVPGDRSLFCPSHQVDFSWSYRGPANEEQGAFELQADNNSDFSSPSISTGQIEQSRTSFRSEPSALELGENYYWRVRARPGPAPSIDVAKNILANISSASLVSAIAAFQGDIYAGVKMQDNSLSVYKYDLSAERLTQIGFLPRSLPFTASNYLINYLKEYQGKLYIGMKNSVWQFDGSGISPAFEAPPDLELASRGYQPSIGPLEVYQNNLYVAIAWAKRGYSAARLYRYDGSQLSLAYTIPDAPADLVFYNGCEQFCQPEGPQPGIKIMKVINNKLYAGVFYRNGLARPPIPSWPPGARPAQYSEKGATAIYTLSGSSWSLDSYWFDDSWIKGREITAIGNLGPVLYAGAFNHQSSVPTDEKTAELFVKSGGTTWTLESDYRPAAGSLSVVSLTNLNDKLYISSQSQDIYFKDSGGISFFDTSAAANLYLFNGSLYSFGDAGKIYKYIISSVGGAEWSGWSSNATFSTPALCPTGPGPDFTLSNSGGIEVLVSRASPGRSSASTITVLPQGGFSGNIELRVISSSLPPRGGQPSFSRSSLDSSNYGAGSRFSLLVPAGTSAGVYNISVEGRSGNIVRTTTIPLRVRFLRGGEI